MNRAHLVLHIFFYLFLHGGLSASAPEYKISKISISGIFTGKDFYRKLYRLTKGMVFKPVEHVDGIKSIEQHLYRIGYLLAKVEPYCYFNDKQQTVHLDLHITTGNLFTVNSVSCLPSNSNFSLEEVDDIFKKLQHGLEKRLKNHYCTQDLLDAQARIISAYLAKKGYLFSSIEMEQIRHDERFNVDVHFNCALKHKKQFIFVGNSAFTAQELYHKCAEFGKALFIIPCELIVQELRDLYIKHGYLDVAITSNDTEKSTLILHIKEGTQAYIENVQLEGLEDIVTLKAPYSFFTSVIKHPYDHKKISNALHVLTLYLVQEGYAQASIQETTMHKQPSGNYQLRVSINTGKQLLVTKIIGNDFQELLTLLYQQKWCKKYTPFLNQENKMPCIVDMNLIARQRKFLQKQLHDRGYLYTQITPHFMQQEKATFLEWQFAGKKDRVHFGNTLIQGSCTVPDSIIKRAITYKKGDVWNKKRLDETATTLRNFGVFDQVTVFPENITQVEDEKTIIIQMQDSDPFELRMRAGFQGVGTNLSWRGGATYKFGGTFLWKNPRKCADIFSLQLDITRFLRYTTLMYQLAFLGNLPIKQQFKVYSNCYEQPVVLGSREILYRFAQDGFLWGLSQDSADTKWGLTSGIDWMQISDISKKLSQAIDFTTRFIDKRIPYFFCEPSVYISDVDNRLDPLAGWYLVLSSKALLPFNVRDAAFIKFLLEQGSYIPLHKPSHTVLAVRLRLGAIAYQKFSNIMPPERFFLGGAYSLRGYEPDLAPPLNFYRNCNEELIVVPTGGKTMMNGNFELRFTIIKSLGGTLFTDIGILTQRAVTDIRAHDIIGASGFGFRWNTPVGPLRFDIGWKWKRFPGNEQFYDQAAYAWFLTLGNAF